jgi:hypothetical protein
MFIPWRRPEIVGWSIFSADLLIGRKPNPKCLGEGEELN